MSSACPLEIALANASLHLLSPIECPDLVTQLTLRTDQEIFEPFTISRIEWWRETRAGGKWDHEFVVVVVDSASDGVESYLKLERDGEGGDFGEAFGRRKAKTRPRPSEDQGGDDTDAAALARETNLLEMATLSAQHEEVSANANLLASLSSPGDSLLSLEDLGELLSLIALAAPSYVLVTFNCWFMASTLFLAVASSPSPSSLSPEIILHVDPLVDWNKGFFAHVKSPPYTTGQAITTPTLRTFIRNKASVARPPRIAWWDEQVKQKNTGAMVLMGLLSPVVLLGSFVIVPAYFGTIWIGNRKRMKVVLERMNRVVRQYGDCKQRKEGKP